MRGRKPKPVEQKRREGNPGKRRLPEPVRLPGGLLKPELPPAASELWDQVVPILGQVGVLASVDRAALTAMCLQWERAVAARRVLEQEGYFALGSTGQLVEHPAVGIERAAHDRLLRFAAEFGITPVARARIAAAAALLRSGEEDDLRRVLDAPPVVLDA